MKSQAILEQIPARARRHPAQPKPAQPNALPRCWERPPATDLSVLWVLAGRAESARLWPLCTQVVGWDDVSPLDKKQSWLPLAINKVGWTQTHLTWSILLAHRGSPGAKGTDTNTAVLLLAVLGLVQNSQCLLHPGHGNRLTCLLVYVGWNLRLRHRYPPAVATLASSYIRHTAGSCFLDLVLSLPFMWNAWSQGLRVADSSCSQASDHHVSPPQRGLPSPSQSGVTLLHLIFYFHLKIIFFFTISHYLSVVFLMLLSPPLKCKL